MLTTIKGYYDHGTIVLDETPLVSTKTEVIVTFLSADSGESQLTKRTLGGLEGLVNISNNFNDPLDDLKEYM